MSRCSCEAGTCACKLLPLETPCIEVIITGTGTLVSPYFISAVPNIDPVTGNQLSCGAAGLLAKTSVTALDTNCINTTVTGVGTVANPYVISSVPTIDPVTGNQLSCGPSGLLVPAAPAAEGTFITVLDTDCIDMAITGIGSAGDPYVISAIPIVDPVTGNQLSCGVDGLFVPASEGGSTSITVLDTDCIDMAITGVGSPGDPYVISAIPIVDPVTGNMLSCEPTGLRADLSAVAADTQCINMTVTGAGTPASPLTISAIPVIDPVTGNQLSCGAAGLLVPAAAAPFNPPTVRVYDSASAQTLANATAVALEYDTELYDTNNMWVIGSPSRITINTAGVYHFFGVISLTGEVDYTSILYFFRLGGVTDIGGARRLGNGDGSGDQPRFNAAIHYKFAVGNFVEFVVVQENTSANDETTVPGLASVTFGATWVANG